MDVVTAIAVDAILDAGRDELNAGLPFQPAQVAVQRVSEPLKCRLGALAWQFWLGEYQRKRGAAGLGRFDKCVGERSRKLARPPARATRAPRLRAASPLAQLPGIARVGTREAAPHEPQGDFRATLQKRCPNVEASLKPALAHPLSDPQRRRNKAALATIPHDFAE